MGIVDEPETFIPYYPDIDPLNFNLLPSAGDTCHNYHTHSICTLLPVADEIPGMAAPATTRANKYKSDT